MENPTLLAPALDAPGPLAPAQPPARPPKFVPPPPLHRARRVRRAVEQCQQAWSDAYRQAIENHLPQDQALRMAAVAYKLQIPKMDTFASTKCAFACITHGISLEVFEGNHASQLLYAVQVATNLFNPKGAKK